MEFIDFHTHLEKENSIISVDPRYSVNTKQKYIYGPHPWFLNELDLNRVESVIRANHLKDQFFGIGEIGIDRCIETCPLEQSIIFERFLRLAKELKVNNVVIHCVRAYSDLIGIFKNVNYNGNIILHDFNANEQTLQQFQKYNSYYSVGARLFTKNAKILKTIKSIPLEKLLLETDDQTKFNINEVYQRTAEVLNIELKFLIEVMKKNLLNLKRPE